MLNDYPVIHLDWAHFYPQCHFICDDVLNLKVDFVGRFESLEHDFAHVQLQLGMPPKPLPHINPSAGQAGYVDCYSQETIDIVASVYRDDIAMFTYDFENSDK